MKEIISEIRRIATTITQNPNEVFSIEIDGKRFELRGQRKMDVGSGVALAAKLIQQSVEG